MLRWMKLGLVTALALSLVALFIYGCAPKPAEPPAPTPAVEAPAPVAPDTTMAPAAPEAPAAPAAPAEKPAEKPAPEKKK